MFFLPTKKVKHKQFCDYNYKKVMLKREIKAEFKEFKSQNFKS